jgi:hypothetical protein
MDLKPQNPAIGISQTFDFEDFKCFEIPCTCTNPDHSVTLCVEKDELDNVTLTMDMKVSTPFWKTHIDIKPTDYDSFFKYRAKMILNHIINCAIAIKDVIIHGQINMTGSIIMSEQQALNVGVAIVNTATSINIKKKK